ncbi:MAG: carbohydrate ABC transporter permease [Chloroflexota bacterium]
MRSFSRNHAWRFPLRLFFAALFVIPTFWMITASLKPAGTPLSSNVDFLEQITFQNYLTIWQLVPLGLFAINSLKVVALAVPLTVITSSWAGFSISQLPRASQRRWVILSIAMLMVPGIALWSSRFIIYKYLGWYNTIWALIAPAWMGTSPFYVLMFYRAFRRIPREIVDSARLDGAGVLKIWSGIALPIAGATTVGVALLSFILYWGDFISPLLYIQSEDNYTLAIALQLLQQMGPSDWSLLMAAAVFTTAVPIMLFLVLQPFFNRSDA